MPELKPGLFLLRLRNPMDWRRRINYLVKISLLPTKTGQYGINDYWLSMVATENPAFNIEGDTILFFKAFKVTEVPLTDLPLYLGWSHSALFDKLMKGL